MKILRIFCFSEIFEELGKFQDLNKTSKHREIFYNKIFWQNSRENLEIVKKYSLKRIHRTGEIRSGFTQFSIN